MGLKEVDKKTFWIHSPPLKRARYYKSDIWSTAVPRSVLDSGAEDGTKASA
jgi:hypothetical protein